ncbi:unnamed protein product [Adineta steineri]|uniref:Uncharacterized protein n=1 Tax=Adineta steineri TaxID=433720 RepID=A0A814MYN7_9BILA|nr:unnamed protein product [Adineta steineri]CAF1175616.1 unnamed protein product [Adineta steineri]
MASQTKVWIRFEEHEPEKVTLDFGADIDDLKEEALKDIKEPKRNFSAFFKQTQLTPATTVPSDTSYDEPIVLKRTQLSAPTISTSSKVVEPNDANSSIQDSEPVDHQSDMPPPYDTVMMQSSEVSVQQINLDFPEKAFNAFSFEESGMFFSL